MSMLLRMPNEESETVAKVIGNSSKVYETVPAAIYYYLKSGGNPLKAIKYSLGGNVSDIAIMASSLLLLNQVLVIKSLGQYIL